MSDVTCHVSRGPPQTVLEDETPGRHGGQPQPRHQQAAQPEGGGDPGAVPEHGDMVQGIQGERRWWCLLGVHAGEECGGLSGHSSGQWTASHPRHPAGLCWAAVCMSLHQHISHTAAGIYTGIATLTLRFVLIHHKGKVTSTYS